MRKISLGNIVIDAELQENGKFDVHICHEGSSGLHYKDVTADKIGELVAEEIENIAEATQPYGFIK